MRQPDAPMGWPIAMAPPLTLTLADQLPTLCSLRRLCAANASFSSNKSTSAAFQPARCRALREAGTGPCPSWRGPGRWCQRRNARQGLEAQRQPAFFGAHHYHGGGAVIDARGIAGRHAAGPCQTRAQASQGFGTGLAVEVPSTLKTTGSPFSGECSHPRFRPRTCPSWLAAAFC